MYWRFNWRRVVAASWLGLAGLALAGHEHSEQKSSSALVRKGTNAIKEVADFDASTWAHLMAHGPRPAAYVFTTTFCSTCPQVFETLDRRIRATGKPMELAAVVMDVPPERVLAHAHHYVGANRFYAFDGFAPAIRQSVDPDWPNVTPYVVLLDRQGAVLYRGIGAPSDKILSRWR